MVLDTFFSQTPFSVIVTTFNLQRVITPPIQLQFNHTMASSIEDAIAFHLASPSTPLRQVAKTFHVSNSTLQYRVSNAFKGQQRIGAGRLLLEAEEKAICNYIERLDKVNLAVRPEFVADAANNLLQARLTSSTSQPSGTADPTVGSRWVTRFLKRYKYDKRTQQQLDSSRLDAEQPEVIQKYFNCLKEALDCYGIQPEDIWNMDETGFRIGAGKNALIVTKRKRAHYFSLPTNRESATAIEAISAGGAVIPAFLILSATVYSAR